MSRRNFIATFSDFKKGLEIIESKIELTYVLCGLFDSADIIKYNSLLEFQNIEEHPTGEYITGYAFLVVRTNMEVQIRPVKQQTGGYKYAIDQLENPDSIIFRPSAIYKNEFIIKGEISTVTDTSQSKELYKDFSQSITKGFKNIKGWHVGNEAYSLYEKGVRLVTISVQSPQIYDLKLG